MGKKKGECCPAEFDTVAKDYNDKVARMVKIVTKANDVDFVPEYSAGATHCCLKAYIGGAHFQPLHPGNTERVSCGFGVKMRAGYDLYVKADNYFTNKGVIVTENFTKGEDGYLDVGVSLTNTGRHIINIAHGDLIGGLSIRPIWYCDFLIK